jgi:predicted methyltransferase
MTFRSVFALLAVLVSSGCATAPEPTPAASTAGGGDFAGLVAATDRTDADRALDPGRKPAQFLAFLGVKPGMRVGELGAGYGYTTELLARAVGPSGTVFGQNAPAMLEKIGAAPWAERLSKPVNKNVVRADKDFADPFPPEATGLDLVVINAIYHDTVWQQVDRAKMNAAVFAALKPGGRYVVVDSSAKDGSGAADAQTLHRIDEQLVKTEVTQAGFKVAASGDFLRNPADTRDWNTSPRAAAERRGTGDRFALAFVKP